MFVMIEADRVPAFMKDHKTLMDLRHYGNDDEPMVDDGEMFSV
jgi:hypothetical protein